MGNNLITYTCCAHSQALHRIGSDPLTSLHFTSPHLCLWTSQDLKLRFGWRRERESLEPQRHAIRWRNGSRFQTHLRSRSGVEWSRVSISITEVMLAFLAVTMCRWPSLLGGRQPLLSPVTGLRFRIESPVDIVSRRTFRKELAMNSSNKSFRSNLWSHSTSPSPSSFPHKPFNVKR